jgi:hypothetical protein
MVNDVLHVGNDEYLCAGWPVANFFSTIEKVVNREIKNYKNE